MKFGEGSHCSGNDQLAFGGSFQNWGSVPIVIFAPVSRAVLIIDVIFVFISTGT